MWEQSGLAARWQAASAEGGARGAAADRDLDAVLALFDAAGRHTERLPPGAPGLFLESLTGQEIPGDTLAERAAAGDAVRVLTAHRSKGLEWDVVIVAGVQEGTWPDLRMRGSLLGVDELVEVAAGSQLAAAEAAAVAATYKLLAEERRLFYVAVTRARHRIVVTAVGGDDTEERPSRFLRELAGDDITIRAGRWCPRALALAAGPCREPAGRRRGCHEAGSATQGGGGAAGGARRRGCPRRAPQPVVRAHRAVRRWPGHRRR